MLLNHCAISNNNNVKFISIQQNGLISSGGCDNGRKEGKESRKVSASRDGLPPHMSFSRAASYNNPHEMFPSTAKLFSGFNR